MLPQDEMIHNMIEYFRYHINQDVKAWKNLYNSLTEETLCCKETPNILLGNVKKILIERSIMHLWTRESIYKILMLVKTEMIRPTYTRCEGRNEDIC